MEQLLEDYQRRLKTITEMINNLPSDCPDKPEHIRLTTKRSCYKTFISELKKAIKHETI